MLHGSLSNLGSNHALQFCNTYIFRREVVISLQAAWLPCCWNILKERNNNIIFALREI
jgi:hypothetical protein